MSASPSPFASLCEPFPPEKVGKLPRITCGDCSRSQGRCCNQHTKSRCASCGSYITSAHIHFDYVGHADVTERLLEVDPEWSWTPLSVDPDPGMLAAAAGSAEALRMVLEQSPPRFERADNGNPVGLWIKLRVLGVERLGYGSVDSGAFDAEKQLIGDSLRNAAMRFGVALQLWSKAERDDASTEPGEAPRSRSTARKRAQGTQGAQEPPPGPAPWEAAGWPSLMEAEDCLLPVWGRMADLTADFREPLREWLLAHDLSPIARPFVKPDDVDEFSAVVQACFDRMLGSNAEQAGAADEATDALSGENLKDKLARSSKRST